MPDVIKICLTGGGTAGHVMPHLALLPDFRQQGWEVFYIGSAGIEKQIIEQQQLHFYTIATGKLRRYFSLQNFFDVGKVIWGIFQATYILLRERPNVIFSKGGFVSVPVAIAARICCIPVVSHESDLTPGLANKIIAPFANKILYTFAETSKYLPANAELVGLPVRRELSAGSRVRGLQLCGFVTDLTRPVLLIMGGSQGAVRLNDAVYDALPQLLQAFYVVHITGKGKGRVVNHDGYKAFEFVGPELADILSATDLVISRAGATAIFEFLSLQKPMLLVPLVVGSRGDQVLNAQYFARQGWAHVVDEATLTSASLMQAMNRLVKEQEAMRAAQSQYQSQAVNQKIIAVLGAQSAS